MALNRVTIDKSFLKNIGYRLPLYTNIPIPLPSDKVLGAPARSIQADMSEQLNVATFFQTNGPDPGISGLPISRQWSCMAYSMNSESDAISQAASVNLDHGARLDQGIERTMHNNPGFDYNQVVQWAVKYYEAIWARFQSEKSMTHPSEHNWAGDYFFPGLGETGAFNHYQNTKNAARMDLFKTFLSSEANARKEASYNVGSDTYSIGGTDAFYVWGLHNYVNRFYDGYYNTKDMLSIAEIYHVLFTSEQHHLANSGLKVFAFDFPTIVDGNAGNPHGGVHLRMPLNPVHNAAISSGWNSPSTNASWTIPHSFFSFDGFDGYLNWNEHFTDTNDMNHWSYNVAPNISLGVTKSYRTQNGLGPFENWDGSFPQPVSPTPYRGTRVVGNNLLMAGAKYYSEISSVDDRVSGGRYYAEGNYSVNGGSTQNGYNGTDVPTYGSLGNARLSDKDNRNYGNDNSLELCKLGKPIMIRSMNSAGTKECIRLCNPYADDTDTTVYTFKDKDGNTHSTDPLRGDALYILKID